MKILQAAISDVLLVQPDLHQDERGSFFESFNQKDFREFTGIKSIFVQENTVRSKKNVLRGLHFQVQKPQAKLVQVVQGQIFDVAVDIRKSSPSFGKWVGFILTGDNRNQLWVPEGFAHGYVVLSDVADVIYRVTDYYSPAYERVVAWDDPTIAISWPIDSEPILSMKDSTAENLSKLELYL